MAAQPFLALNAAISRNDLIGAPVLHALNLYGC